MILGKLRTLAVFQIILLNDVQEEQKLSFKETYERYAITVSLIKMVYTYQEYLGLATVSDC